MKTIVALGIALGAVAAPQQSFAQSRFLSNAAFGSSPRLGASPGNVARTSGNYGALFQAGIRATTSFFATAAFDATIQHLNVADRADQKGGTFAFHTYTFAAGPTLVRRSMSGLIMMAGAYPAYSVSFWGASSVNDCRRNCTAEEVRPRDKQTQGTVGALLSFGLAYQIVEAGRIGERPYALGLQGRMLATPQHRATGLPVSQWGVYLLLVGGEP